MPRPFFSSRPDADVTAEMFVCESKGHVRTFMDHRAFQEALAFLDQYLQLQQPAKD